MADYCRLIGVGQGDWKTNASNKETDETKLRKMTEIIRISLHKSRRMGTIPPK